jgi:hypothetical protein
MQESHLRRDTVRSEWGSDLGSCDDKKGRCFVGGEESSWGLKWV